MLFKNNLFGIFLPFQTPRPGAEPAHILAVASKGGHWDELMQLRAAFDSAARVSYATTDPALAAAADLPACITLSDYSQSEPFKVLRGAIETFGLVRRLRPDVVISAGAAPGLLCLLWGRVFGAKTIWIDSIANAETLSLSGKIALHFAHRVLTQWDHLARPGKVEHWGSVL